MFKISILGKILLFALLPILVFAQATASLNKIAVLKGKSITLSITASGSNIEFPQLRTVEGNKVIATSSSSRLSIVNGVAKRSKTVSYKFIPQYSFEIPNYSIIVDGQEQQTEPIKLKVIKPQASQAGDDLLLQIKFSKYKAYVGENLVASLIFKYKIGTSILQLDLEDFAPKHFFLKSLDDQKQFEENGYIVVQQDYIVFPQLAGKFTIEKQVINVAKREAKTNLMRWQKIFSNENKLDILPLPNSTSIQGDYTINATIDKNSTKSNDPINLTLNILGSGNIDDIEEFKLNLDNEIVYSSKPTIKTYFKDGKYMGEFNQKLSIIADESYSIPPIKFIYFNVNDKKIHTIKTKIFNIIVKPSKKELPTVQTKNSKQEIKTIQLPAKIIIKTEDFYTKYLFALFGLIAGILSTYLTLKRKIQVKVVRPFEAKIKKAKNHEELYKILIPYSFNSRVVSYIKTLEDNIYNNKNMQIDKKELFTMMMEENLISS
jgi:hypothetical protein